MKYLHLVFLDRRVFSKSLFAVWLLVISGFGAGIASAADDVVVPSALEFVEGNTENCFPLSGCRDLRRYHQVFSKSEFSTLPVTGPQYVSEISFRPDGTAPQVPAIFTDIEINLSTPPASDGPDMATAIGPDNLFPTFADNIGADAANVYRGALSLSTSRTGPGPFDFDLVIALQTPFLYDPALGHLLFEWKNFSGESVESFADAEVTFGDSVSRVRGFFDPEAPSGSPDSFGLITKFTFVGPDELSVTNASTPVEDDFPVVNLPQFFEQRADVIKAGITSADFCVGLDPREGGPRFKQKFLNVSDLSNTGSCGDLSEIESRLPPWYRGFPGKFPNDGNGEAGVWLVVASVRSTAEYLGPVKVLTFAESLIDYTDMTVTPNPPGCDTDLKFRELSLGGAEAEAGFDDHLNIEVKRMIQETVSCNSGRSLGRRTLHVYPVRLDGKKRDERINVALQLAGIQGTLGEAALCVDPDDMVAFGVIAVMQSLVEFANEAFAEGRYDGEDGAIKALEQAAREAKFNSNNFSGCPTDRNYVGNFVARGLGAAFTIFDRFLHPVPTTEPGGDWVVYEPPPELVVFD